VFSLFFINRPIFASVLSIVVTLADAISFTFPTNTLLASSNYLVIARLASHLITNYPALNSLNTLGDFNGKLSGGGERLTLRKFDTATSTNGVGVIITNFLHIVMDEVTHAGGGRWPELARAAACGLTARAQEYSPIGSLLMDIYVVFAVSRSERIFSRDLVAALLGCGDRPWSELRKGKPVTETWVAQQLRTYGIKPRTIRIGELVAKGYVQEEFMDTFRRYIPKSEVETLKAEWAERDKPKAAQGDGTGEKANGGTDNSPKGPDVEE